MMTPSTKSLSDRRPWTALPMIFALFCATNLLGADSAPQVTFETRKATPRAVEPLTQRSIVRDYKMAWTNLSLALDSNSAGPLNGLFSGTANERFLDAVKGQQKSGISTRYSNQNHKLEAVFYAQEGDVIELHDTSECDIQISDGSKTIHSEHAVVHYVVLMTPGADRWVIRQLQAVPQF
jgi:hypothetical protein